MLITDKQPIKESRTLAPPTASGMPVVQPRLISAPAESGIDVLDSLERQWLLAAGIFVVCMAVGFVLIRHFVKPTYQAETTVYVSPSVLKDNADYVSDVSYLTLINQQILTIIHYDTLSGALRRLDAEGHPWRGANETEQAAIDRLRDSITVGRIPDSYEISIAATGQDPKSLAPIANAVAEAYLNIGGGEDVSERSNRLAILTRDKSDLEKELNQKLETAAKFSGTLQVVDLDKYQTLPDDAVLAQMRVALAAAHQKRIEAEQQLAVDEQSGAAAQAEQIVMSDAATRTMVNSLLQRQFDLRFRIGGMLPANPLRKTAEKELSGISGQLLAVPAEMVRTIGTQLVDKLHSDLDQFRRIELALGNEVTEHATGMEATSRELHKAQAMNADIDRLRAHLRNVEERIDALKLQSEMPGFLRIFSVAQLPLQPLKSQKRKAMFVLLGLALMLGLFFPVVLDALDPHIHNPANVERALGFLPVGMTIERKPGREEFAEEHLRRLAAGIQRGIARGARTVVLTPLKLGAPNTVAEDIAQILTERGFRAVLVHANRQRLVSNGLERIGGGGRQVTALGPHGSMLKNSDQDCDVVLISAPPLLLSADAELLTSEADMTLIIVQAGKSTRKEVEQAGRLLERLRAPEVGAILTSVRVERAGRVLKSELRDYMTLRTPPAGAET